MNKTLIILAIIALIAYWYYKHQAKLSKENWIWEENLALSDFNEELQTLNQEAKDWKSQYINLELANEALKEQIQNFPQHTTLLEEIEELTLERDEAIRSRNEAQAEVLALNNLVKNKNQEVANKERALALIKKEMEEKEVSWQAKLKELQKQIKDLEKSQDE